jgi:lysophospholipase L1-like esterase
MINFGSAGAKTDEYSGFGTPGIAYHKPAIVCYSAYSPNDAATPTQATFDIMFRRWIAIANAAQAQGALPVAVFLAPNNNLATTEDNLRKAFIARVKAGGYPVIDLTTVTGDSATPQRYITGLNTDNLHPNDAGYDAMAVAFLAQLLALVLQTCTL